MSAAAHLAEARRLLQVATADDPPVYEQEAIPLLLGSIAEGLIATAIELGVPEQPPVDAQAMTA